MLQRLRGILISKDTPKDKEVMWVKRNPTGELITYVYNGYEWTPISSSAASAFYMGDTEPDDKEVIWITNVDTSEYKEENTIIQNLYRRMEELEKIYSSINNVIKYGAVAGNSEIGGRVIMMNSAEPVNPNEDSEDTEGEDTEDTDIIPAIQPLGEDLKYTVPNISIKMDSSNNFQTNINNLIDGELCWITDYKKLYIYYKGEFISVGGSAGGSGVSIEEIMAFFFNYLGFQNQLEDSYRVCVDENGKVTSYYYKERNEIGGIYTDSGAYIAPRLSINTIFCGGEGDAYSYQSCTHNFVELGNGGTEDVNLDNIYLLYAANKDTPWKACKLRGKIKAGSTYLIRGAQCAIKTNTTIIDVDEYDLEWYDNGKLISFAQESPIFYLVCSENGLFYNLDGEKVGYSELTRAIYKSTNLVKGYIDLVGIGSEATAEGDSPVAIVSGDSFKDLLFVRYYTLDPVSQANKVFNSRKSSALWTYINLQKESNEDLDNPLYYYTKSSKINFRPRASESGKNIFTSKSVFSEKTPNMVNITFGIQATDNGGGATRCFNWVSVGYYDEYLEWGTSPDNLINKEYSIHEGGTYDSSISRFIDIYKRLRWITTNHTAVTTHKLILKNLPAGDYYYRVRREGDDSYKSDIMSFTVKADSEVGNFEFVQVSDQQGFNWLEYQAWKKAALHISDNHPNVAFTLNTGDITQNGNRESEWLDYYDGRQYLRNKEEMFTIGNNDLCGVTEYLLGTGNANIYKINHKNITHYYTYEIDPNNPTIFTSDEVEFYMPSVYSFNYGKFHFVALNSEFAANTYKVYTDTETITGKFKQDTYRNMADWFERDLENYKAQSGETNCSKCIVYCHEAPYTILTYAIANDGSKARGGSKLNDALTGHSDGYYFSRLFKKYGIRLVMCGHKHTYSMTNPVYDAPLDYLDGGVDLMDSVSKAASRVPIVQILDASEAGDEGLARYEIVDKIDAPTYIMCQATGFKLVSNKDVPCRAELPIGWLKAFFPGIKKTSTDSQGNIIDSGTDNANPQQYYPTYIHYTVTDNSIEIKSNQITNIYSTKIGATKAGSFNINNQIIDKTKDQEILGGEGYTITL